MGAAVLMGVGSAALMWHAGALAGDLGKNRFDDGQGARVAAQGAREQVAGFALLGAAIVTMTIGVGLWAISGRAASPAGAAQ